MTSNEQLSKMVAFTWYWSMELGFRNGEWQEKRMDGLWYMHVFRTHRTSTINLIDPSKLAYFLSPAMAPMLV
jgi:hypothetical protein